MIRYSTQNIDDQDIQSVVNALTSDFLTQGPCIEKFEVAISSYVGAQYASVVSSATAALHIACKSLGVGKDSIVWTTPNSFAATSNAALYCGAKIDFVDIELQTYNLCVNKLEEKLIASKKNNCLPDVVIPVHFAGQSCNMKKIHELGQTYGFSIVEDASHALGGTYQDQKIGCCAYADMAVFSFHPVKMITTGEGGAIVTNSKDLDESNKRFRSHCMVKKEGAPPWESTQVDLGFNYRITELQAALGLSQITKIDQYVQHRREGARHYRQILSELPIALPTQSYGEMSYHLFVIRLIEGSDQERKIEIFRKLQEKGIGCQVHYRPIYLHDYYATLGFEKGYCPVAEEYYKSALSIPLHTKLSSNEQDQIAEILSKILLG